MKKKCKITPELTAKAKEYIKLGFSYTALAASLNISEDTLYLWFRKARESGQEPYISFYVAVKEGEAELLTECLESVKASMKHDPKAAFFMLERRFSNEGYGKTSQLDIKAQVDSRNLNVNTTADEMEKIRENILSKLSEQAERMRLNSGEG